MNQFNIPYELLNRHGRRAQVAIARKLPMTLRKEAAERHAYHQKRERQEALARRVARSRARAAARREVALT